LEEILTHNFLGIEVGSKLFFICTTKVISSRNNHMFVSYKDHRKLFYLFLVCSLEQTLTFVRPMGPLHPKLRDRGAIVPWASFWRFTTRPVTSQGLSHIPRLKLTIVVVSAAPTSPS